MSLSIEEKKKQVLKELGSFKDRDEQLRHIIQQGRELAEMNPQFKIPPFQVKGCISQAWLAPEKKGHTIYFHADSEAAIVKGIIALFLSVYNDSTADEILATPGDFLSEAGVSEHLSMNRRNGLSNIVSMIQSYARAFKTAESAPPSSLEEDQP